MTVRELDDVLLNFPQPLELSYRARAGATNGHLINKLLVKLVMVEGKHSGQELISWL